MATQTRRTRGPALVVVSFGEQADSLAASVVCMARRFDGVLKVVPVVLASLVLLATSGSALAESTVQELMRQKLESAHGILDGLALGDFGKIEGHAEKLKSISIVTTWYKADHPEFQHFAKNFQNSAAFLAEQARAKNLEGVAMGYIRVTLDCMQCHQKVRSQSK